MYAASDGPVPNYTALQSNIDRWGASAVLGGPLGIDDIANISAAEAVVSCYEERQAAENMAEWNKANPEKRYLISQARQAAKDAGWSQP